MKIRKDGGGGARPGQRVGGEQRPQRVDASELSVLSMHGGGCGLDTAAVGAKLCEGSRDVPPGLELFGNGTT